MSHVPGFYPLSVAAIAGLAGWTAHGIGKDAPDVALPPDPSPKPAITKEVTCLDGMAHRLVKEAYQAWMDIRAPAAPIPERVLDGFNANFIFRPDEMRGWLGTLEPGPVRDAFHERSLSHLAAHRHFDQAAKFTTTIEDPAIRSAALKSLQKPWRRSNAEAAKAWATGLPENDRAALAP